MSQQTFVGIDVAARQLEVQVKARSGKIWHRRCENSPQGHQALLRRLTRHSGPVLVCLEATGVYGLDLAVTLSRHPQIKVGVLNPRQVKSFADALKKRCKDDPVDADVLCQHAERMDFEAWEPPSPRAMQLRALGRRLHQLTQTRVQEKNRLHAAESSQELAILRQPIERSLERIEAEIEEIQAMALEIVRSESELLRSFDHLCSIRGIGEKSALAILSEICVLPDDMTKRQWVAHAGLDPRIHRSGSSVERRPRISKRGNKYLRTALFMPALTAAHHEPAVKRFKTRLVERGKAKMQAQVAVMRKLLHAIHGMLKNDEDFVAERFSPAEKVASAA